MENDNLGLFGFFCHQEVDIHQNLLVVLFFWVIFYLLVLLKLFLTYPFCSYKANLSGMVISEATVRKVTKGAITSVALHPSEVRTLVAAGAKSGQIGLWDLVSWYCLLGDYLKSAWRKCLNSLEHLFINVAWDLWFFTLWFQILEIWQNLNLFLQNFNIFSLSIFSHLDIKIIWQETFKCICEETAYEKSV